MNKLIKLLKILMNTGSLFCLFVIWFITTAYIYYMLCEGGVEYGSTFIPTFKMLPFMIAFLPFLIFVSNKIRKFIFTINTFKTHIVILLATFSFVIVFFAVLLKYIYTILTYW